MADGNKRIARALYESADKEEKKKALALFTKLSGKEFKKGVQSELSNEKVWIRDGRLDFDGVLVVFYYKKGKIIILRCDVCRALILGPSFCCFQCLFNTPDSRYALCPDCYKTVGESKHDHPLWDTSASASASASASTSDEAILLNLSQLVGAQPLRKKDMEKLWKKVSESGEASPELKAMADNFFNSVDDKGQVRRQHFSILMTQQLENFLQQNPDSDPATNWMKRKFIEAHGLSNSPLEPTAAQENSTSTSISTSTSTHQITRREGSSRASGMLKVMSTTFKIVDMALTIASLASTCTIM